MQIIRVSPLIQEGRSLAKVVNKIPKSQDKADVGAVDLELEDVNIYIVEAKAVVAVDVLDVVADMLKMKNIASD